MANLTVVLIQPAETNFILDHLGNRLTDHLGNLLTHT